MRRFVVGTDKDGVLTNMSKYKIEKGRDYFGQEPINLNGYSTREIFGVSKLQDIIFGLKFLDEYFLEVETREDASNVINSLIEFGCEFHEITAAMFTTIDNKIGEKYRNYNEEWNNKNNLSFSSIQYCSESNSPRDKYIACHKLDVDVMIEDKSDVAIYLAERGIQVLLMDTPYNKAVIHENIKRVHSWIEIKDNIITMMKEKNIFETSDIFKDQFQILSFRERENLDSNELNTYFSTYRLYLKNLYFNREALEIARKNFKLCYAMSKPLLTAIFRPKVIGKKNVPYQKGMIFAFNHLNSYDQYLIQLALGKRHMVGLAASSIKDTFRGKIFTKLGSIFIDRNDSLSRKRGEEQLAINLIHGNDILIFPEGTRKNKTSEGKKLILQKFKLGPVSLAQKTGAAIVPGVIKYGIFPKVIFGEPITVEKTDDLKIKTEYLESIIYNLISDSEKRLTFVKK
ncbi:MAG: 1-acyl-sn-glycerol-3-phosphate acyltransferase [Bacilli bacterium]|nr:1-acyl-sn-glycerol-3-phosphate acyltransferase [Bacilli bacterium]